MICFAMSSQTIIPFKSGANTQNLVEPTITKTIQGTNATYTFQAVNAEKNTIVVDGILYSTFVIKGCGSSGYDGQAYLPAYYECVKVSSQNATLTIGTTQSVLRGSYNIYPVQPMQAISDTSGVNAFYLDSMYYSTNTYTPQPVAEIQSFQEIRGDLYAIVKICPIQYNPVLRRVRLYSKIVYTITNYEIPVSYSEPEYESIQDDYFIVCNDSVVSILQNFMEWKYQQGYKLHLISKSHWSNVGEVKNAIRTIYSTCNKYSNKYLLIIGGHSNVPLKYVTCNDRLSDGTISSDYASDYEYATITNNNLEQQDYPTIAVGRIPYNTISELNVILSKIINYQKHPYYTGSNVNIARFIEDPNKVGEGTEHLRFVRTSEDIKNYMDILHLYTTQRVYYTLPTVYPEAYSDNFSTEGEFPEELWRTNYNWNGTQHKMIEAINNNPNLVLYCGHGTDNAWQQPSAHSTFNSTHIDSLCNTNCPIILSIACKTGKIAIAEHNTIQPQDCFAFNLLKKENGGACAVMALTEKGYAGVLDVLTAAWYDSMFPNPGLNVSLNNGQQTHFPHYRHNYTIGNALVSACYKTINTNLYNWNNGSLTMRKRFHCFGDPTTELYTSSPEDLSVVTVKQRNDSIFINTNGIHNVTIMLLPMDSLYSYYRADSISGEYVFTDITMPYNISIQKHNCALKYYSLEDIPIQNMEFSKSNYTFEGTRIRVGYNITDETTYGPVIIKPSSNVKLKGHNSVRIENGFKIEQGGTLKINMP